MAERILVLDSESTSRNAIVAALTAYGLAVDGAAIDRTAFDTLRNGDYDLLVVNARKMAGPASQVLQLIKRTCPGADILLLCDNQKITDGVNALGGLATSVFSLNRLGSAVDGVRTRRHSMLDQGLASLIATPLDANRRLSGGEPIEEVAQDVLQALAADIGADYISLRLLESRNEEERRDPKTTFLLTLPPFAPAGPAPVIEGRVIEREQPVLFLSGPTGDIPVDRELARGGVSAAFGVPLIDKRKLVGVLTAIVFAPRAPFSNSAVHIASLVAGSFAGLGSRRAAVVDDLGTTFGAVETPESGRQEEIDRLNNAVESLAGACQDAQQRFLQALRALTATIDARESTRQGHSQAVEQIVTSLAERLRMPASGVVEAALLHDAGMLAVPDAVLSAKRHLGKEEWALIHSHPAMGEELAKNIGLGEEVLLAIRHHHENYDGSGYPDGLAAGNIPLLARILRVADSYVVMRSARPWRKALDPSKAVRELQADAGKRYDPAVVAALIEMVNIEVEDETQKAGGAELISTLSHELRSPLTSLLGYSELLSLQPDLPTTAREAAAEIKEETLYLSRLVDTLLKIGRDGTGTVELNRQPVDFGALIRSMKRYEAIAGQHELLIEVADDLPELFIDPDRIMQVLTNLVDNAAKFSPSGGRIRISVTLSSDEVMCSVDDQGIGIPEDDIDRIFDLFYRGDSDAVKGVRGTGLGLSICRRAVEAHGGRIWALNREGGGATITFTLPVHPDVPE